MLTPLDIENKRFSRKKVNGYNVFEVDDFLDEVTNDYEKIYKENTSLKDKIDELNNSLVQYKTIENTLQNTLLMAQTTAEDVKNIAKQQAEQIVADAQINAKKQVEILETEIKDKRKELEEIQRQFDIYKAKMESLLISQLELLKDVNDEN